MHYQFVLLEDFFKTWQIEYINLLDSCGLLNKFTPDCKKILIYLFITHMNTLLSDRYLLFYHINTLSRDLEIFDYIDYDDFNLFMNKLVAKIRSLTGRMFTISQTRKSLIHQSKHISELDGCIQDEILLLDTIKLNHKAMKEFLSSLRLKDIFKDMSWRCC